MGRRCRLRSTRLGLPGTRGAGTTSVATLAQPVRRTRPPLLVGDPFREEPGPQATPGPTRSTSFLGDLQRRLLRLPTVLPLQLVQRGNQPHFGVAVRQGRAVFSRYSAVCSRVSSWSQASRMASQSTSAARTGPNPVESASPPSTPTNTAGCEAGCAAGSSLASPRQIENHATRSPPFTGPNFDGKGRFVHIRATDAKGAKAAAVHQFDRSATLHAWQERVDEGFVKRLLSDEHCSMCGKRFIEHTPGSHARHDLEVTDPGWGRTLKDE